MYEHLIDCPKEENCKNASCYYCDYCTHNEAAEHPEEDLFEDITIDFDKRIDDY